MLGANQILQERYRIVRQLGQGGMGAVYEAIDERFGEPIALKEIIIDLTSGIIGKLEIIVEKISFVKAEKAIATPEKIIIKAIGLMLGFLSAK